MKLLIIGFVWPEPNSSAAGSRMVQLIGAFRSEDYQITFASAAAKSEHAVNLDALGVSCEKIKLNHSSFDLFIDELQPDVVLFDRFMTEEQYGWRVSEQCPNAFRILDTEDLHSLRKSRQECSNNGEEFTIGKWLQADITKREIASIYRCDLSLIISNYEVHLLHDILKIEKSLLHYLPFMLDEVTMEHTKKIPSFDDRKHFITIGNFRHEPNYDSIVYLKEIIWPMIRKELPESEMHIYGSYPMAKVTQLNSKKEGFLIKGWADNVDEIMGSARVCLAPLRFGAGIKGKFIDAMKNGTPSVTTSIGAEGIDDDFGGIIEDRLQEIVNKAVQLYTNETLWNEKQEAGYRLLKQFDKTKLQKGFLVKLKAARKQILYSRQNNFIGAMLQHQSMQGSKYMSKWIEEKNDNVQSSGH